MICCGSATGDLRLSCPVVPLKATVKSRSNKKNGWRGRQGHPSIRDRVFFFIMFCCHPAKEVILSTRKVFEVVLGESMFMREEVHLVVLKHHVKRTQDIHVEGHIGSMARRHW